MSSLYNIYWICQSSNSYFIFHHSAALYIHVVEKDLKIQSCKGDDDRNLARWINLPTIVFPLRWQIDFYILISDLFFFTLFSSFPWSTQSCLELSRKAAGASAEQQSTTPAALSGLPADLCAQDSVCLNTPDMHLWKYMHGKDKFISLGEHTRGFGKLYL